MKSGGEPFCIIVVVFLFVFLILAAKYERYEDPGDRDNDT